MKNQTVVGIFNTATEAQNAVKQLAAAGFELDFVDVSQASSSASSTSDNYTNTSDTATEAVGDAAGRTKDSVGGFFSSLFGGDNDEADTYAQVTRSGHSLVTVHVDTAEQAHQAAEVLDNAGALDVDSKAAEYGVSNSYTAGRAAAPQPTANTNTNTNTNGLKAEVIEESLQVGKRTEQTGGVRLRSRIVEKPVEASVRLREEHVTVQRTPVNRAATDADFTAFKEGDVTLTESAERAVVGKEAKVIEEVSLGKQVTEREEVIRDTVRNTEVDVEQISGTSATSANTITTSNQPGQPGRA